MASHPEARARPNLAGIPALPSGPRNAQMRAEPRPGPLSYGRSRPPEARNALRMSLRAGIPAKLGHDRKCLTWAFAFGLYAYLCIFVNKDS